MIKTALVAMTVMGCDCDARLCEFIAETPAQFATVAECEAAMKAQIVGHNNFDYPLISGFCRSVPAQPAQLADADLHFDTAPTSSTTSRPGVTAAFYSEVINGGEFVFRRTADGYTLLGGGLGRAKAEAVRLLQSGAALLPGY